MRYLIGLGLFLLLTGCATTTTNYYTKTIDSWRGGNANTLVQRWGTPDRKLISPNGNTIYAYKTTSYRTYAPTHTASIGVNVGENGRPVMISQPNTNMTGNRGLSLTCLTVFTANKQGMITSVQSQGDSCYASESFAKRMMNPTAQ